jgi:hypothetical protein
MWDKLILILSMFMAFPVQVICGITCMLKVSIWAEDSVVLGWQGSPEMVSSINIAELGLVCFFTGDWVDRGKECL